MTHRPSNVQVSFADAEEVVAARPRLQVRGRTLLGAIGLVILVGVVFAGYVPGRFVLADHENVVANPAAHNWRQGLRAIWLEPRAWPARGPLAYTLILTEMRAFGARPAVFHAISILLHATNVVLFWLLLRRAGMPAAFVAAALFAAHPVHAETIASVSHQRVLLGASFYLAGLCWWMHSNGRSLWSILAMVAASLCHPIGLTFPLAAALLNRSESSVRPLVIMSSLALVAAGGAMVLHGVDGSAPLAVGRSLTRLVWPAGPGQPLAWDHLLYLPLAALVVLVGVVVLARRGGIVVVGAIVVALAVVTSLRASTYRTDESIWRAVLRSNPRSADALAQLGRIELNRRAAPREATAFFERALAVDANHRAAMLGLADAMGHMNQWDVAVQRYRQLLARDPRDADALFGLGVAYAKQDRTDDAIASMQDVLRVQPAHARAHLELCALYRQRGDTRRALEHGEAAVRLDPRRPDAYIELATLVLTRMHDVDRAQRLLEQARRLDLGRPETVFLAGTIQFEIAKMQTDAARRAEALAKTVALFREAVRVAPGSAMAHKNLGIALAASSQQSPQPPEVRLDALNAAIFHFERAATLDPAEPGIRELRNGAVRDRDALAGQNR